MPMKKGNKCKNVYYSPSEWETVTKKAVAVGMRTGSYIRDISVNGKIIFYDMKQFNHLIMSFNRIGAQLNQIARVANSERSVYAKDIEDMRESYADIKEIFENYLLPIETGETPKAG